MKKLTKKQENMILEEARERDFESGNKCLGQESCKTCPRYFDDCDGKH